MDFLYRAYCLIDTIRFALCLWQPMNCFMAWLHPELTFEPLEVIRWRTAWEVARIVCKD